MIPSSFLGFVPAKFVAALFPICAALSIAACSGSDLSVDLRGEGGEFEPIREGQPIQGGTLKLEFSPGETVEYLLPRISGGIPPYESNIEDCPDWVTLFPDQRILAVAVPPTEINRVIFCTYRVTESDPGFRSPQSVTYGLRLEVTGGATPLALTRVFEEIDDDELILQIGRRSQTRFQTASGGIEPYTYELLDCTLPDGLEFHSSTRVLSGTPKAEYRGPNCSYRVTDSSSPPASVSLSFLLVVEPLEASDWRFRTRTVEPGQGLCVVPGSGSIAVATLPAAHAGEGRASYALPDAPEMAAPGSIWSFDPEGRVLTYANPDPPPVFGTPDTYLYLVGEVDDNDAANVDATNADDVLCLDVQVNSGEDICPGDDDATPPLRPEDQIHIQLQVRDDAFRNERAGEYRCPDTTAPPPRSGTQSPPSNPVHEALGPVHVRRALDFAYGAVEDRIGSWSPGAPGMPSTITSAVGFGTLSGRSSGFDYSGSSQSLSAGAELGTGSWQAGLIASFTGTELDYRAEAGLAERGYLTGEHDTRIFSLHPFAAWHLPSGGHLWASLGAGMGRLSHRDERGFPSWSRSDVRLRTHAVGAGFPIADALSGELEAETSIESFAFEIEGGDRISSSLPTFRGRDWRAGLAWSAPIAGAPSLSVFYKRLTGDGPEGGQLEARGSVSVEGLFDPRLTVTGNLEGSFGLGDFEHDSWGLGGGYPLRTG